MSSGSKRSWEGSEHRETKRHRDDSRDWRDVHLHSSSSSRRHTPSKRGPSDYGKHSERGRERSHSRSGHHKRSSREPSPGSKAHGLNPQPAKATAIVAEEREEGEISPPPLSKQENEPEPAPTAMPPNTDMEIDIPISPPPVEDTLAARRARREAIKAKYAGSNAPSAAASGQNSTASAVQPPSSSAISDQTFPANSTNEISSPAATGSISKAVSKSPSPDPGTDFSLAKDNEEDVSQQANAPGSALQEQQVSAADYDPSQDRREEEKRHLGIKEEPDIQEVPEEIVVEESDDDDLDDMFSVAAEDKPKKVKKTKRVAKPAAPALVTTTLDSAADSEGYYTVILGEQLDGGRYQVFSSLGKGMFANVVRARVLQSDSGEAGREVAIKIVRYQESMYKAGLKEIQMLNKLMQADPDDKKHIVRLERTFEHRGHLCLVFESMSMNLRDVVKRFGKDVGLNIRAVRAYAYQLFLALSLLRKVNVMHADIKPDNILVNEAKTMLKLCDLGSASDASENDITPYLVSRFYRAPEIILGVPYDPSLDIWSIGCTLYELYTGKILFPGRSNNQMLLLMMELKGRFNGKMIKKAKFGELYFDEMGAFESVEKDKVLGNDVVRKVHITKPSRDLRARLMPGAGVKMKDDEREMVASFVDLVDKCLALDPARRIAPREALVHPFIRG